LSTEPGPPQAPAVAAGPLADLGSPPPPAGLNRADLALLAVAAIWGTTFSLLRESLRLLHPVELMAIRFSIAALLVAAIYPRRLWPVRRQWLRDGAWLGLWLTSGYLTQVIGLSTITAARSAFITSTYIIFAPLIGIPLARALPGLGDYVGVVLAFGGIALFSSNAGFSLASGDLWTLGCALSFGVQIVVTHVVAKRNDPIALSVVQMAVGALAGWTLVAARGGFHTPFERVPWGMLIYLAVVATSLVIVVQTWALARTTPVKAALMFATEPIFAAIFAVSFFGEGMTRREVWGGALIMLGVLTTELWRPVVARLRGRAAA
jgi:drug/metabolite transporter (DMT)-like permease